jgi:hypothetical protein
MCRQLTANGCSISANRGYLWAGMRCAGSLRQGRRRSSSFTSELFFSDPFPALSSFLFVRRVRKSRASLKEPNVAP